MNDRHTWILRGAIAARAEREIDGWSDNVTRQSCLMDLESLPDLDLASLLDATSSDFVHDMVGIANNMDRSQFPGKLKNCFEPRHTKRTFAGSQHTLGENASNE